MHHQAMKNPRAVSHSVGGREGLNLTTWCRSLPSPSTGTGCTTRQSWAWRSAPCTRWSGSSSSSYTSAKYPDLHASDMACVSPFETGAKANWIKDLRRRQIGQAPHKGGVTTSNLWFSNRPHDALRTGTAQAEKPGPPLRNSNHPHRPTTRHPVRRSAKQQVDQQSQGGSRPDHGLEDHARQQEPKPVTGVVPPEPGHDHHGCRGRTRAGCSTRHRTNPFEPDHKDLARRQIRRPNSLAQVFRFGQNTTASTDWRIDLPNASCSRRLKSR